jgi:hypothetical protein
MDNSKARTELSASDTHPSLGLPSDRSPFGAIKRWLCTTDVLATDGRVGQLEAKLWRLASGIGNFNIWYLNT